MPTETPTTPAAAATLSLWQRLRRLWPYFGQYRAGWLLAIGATFMSGLTEPAIPALLKPLLDQGFTEGDLQLWMVPTAIIGLFTLRGLAQFASKYALSR